MIEIPLHGPQAAGRIALIGDEDFDLVNQYRWYVWEKQRVARHRKNGPYAITRATLSMHKLIMGRPYIDHLDHNGLNNQRLNLRPATGGQNNANRLPSLGKRSRFKGVDWCRDSWRVRITVDREVRFLGLYTDEEEAARVYDISALASWGEYACLNFPDDREPWR